MSEPAHGTLTLTAAVADEMLDAELGALVWQLAEAGVPVVVATTAPALGHDLRSAFARVAGARAAAHDGPAGGVVLGRSLEDVLRLAGASSDGALADEARDLGVVLILAPDTADAGRGTDVGRGADPGRPRVVAAHYVRPVERDAAGHLQRRPPALLAAWDGARGGYDHFHWGISHELASRTTLERSDFEAALDQRARLLADLAAAGVVDPLDERHAIDAMALHAPDSAAEAADTRH